MQKYKIFTRFLLLVLVGAIGTFIIYKFFAPEESRDGQGDTQIVQGLDGKEIEITNDVKRIVTIPWPGASLFISLDGKPDRLVGINPGSKEAILDGILGEFYPEAKNINSDVVSSGYTPNIEEILKEKPDVVVQWGYYAPKTFKPMENAGLKVAALGKYSTEEEALKSVKTAANILNKEEKYDELVKWRKDMQTKISEKGGRIKKRKSVVIIVNYKKGLTVYGDNSYPDFFVSMAGGVLYPQDVKEGKSNASIDMEQLLQWNPDIIGITNFDPLTPEEIYNDKKFSSLKAVKNKRVYKIPLGGYRWAVFNQESPLAWMWFYNILNPGKESFDIRTEIKNAYKFIYEKEPTEAQIDNILHMDLNKASVDYNQFN